MSLVFADVTQFHRFGTLEWFRIDLGIFEFGLVNLIRLFDFLLWIRAVWVDLADFNRFDLICVDLGCFERLTMTELFLFVRF